MIQDGGLTQARNQFGPALNGFSRPLDVLVPL